MVLESEIFDYGEQGADMLVRALEGELPNGQKEILIPLDNLDPRYIRWVEVKVGASLFMSEWCSDDVYAKGRHKV